jgi:hypothetical protein
MDALTVIRAYPQLVKRWVWVTLLVLWGLAAAGGMLGYILPVEPVLYYQVFALLIIVLADLESEGETPLEIGLITIILSICALHTFKPM